jgi:hypothetical protein
MRRIVIVLFILMTGITSAQNAEKVWELLLANKREDARKLFNKTLKEKTSTDVEALVLDAMIDIEQGRFLFDETFISKLAKIKDSEYYLYPLWDQPFVIGDLATSGYDDLSFKKMDFIANTEQFKNDPQAIYWKAILDRKRYNHKDALEYIKKLNPITKWQFCGVFENINESGINTEYEPELYAMNDRTFSANSNGMVNWYVPKIPQTEGYHIYKNEQEYGNGIIYAQTFIESDIDREVVLNFGANGPLKIFVNDSEIYFNDKIMTNDLNAFHLKFNLKKGVNRLLLKSSTTGNSDYFFASLRDVNQNVIPQLVFHDSYKPYVKSSVSQINPLEIKPSFEQYLIDKVKANPNSHFYKILLFDVYLSNHKLEEAYDAIEELSVRYPNSSLLNVRLIKYYGDNDDAEKVTEIEKNLMLNDEDYYYCIIAKFQEDNWLEESNISEIEKYRDKSKKLLSQQYVVLYDYFLALRNQDIELAFKKVEELVAMSHNNDIYTTMYAQLFTTVKSDKEKTLSLLKEVVARNENFAAENVLLNHYYTTGKRDLAKEIIMKRIENYPYFNNMYDDAIRFSNNENDYAQALKYTEIGLGNFPYSFRLMEQKGRSHNLLKNPKEAEKFMRQSLTYNSENSGLRKVLNDITKVPDEIEQVATKDIYSLIKQRRNSKMPSDFGVNILLDEYNVNINPEGGRKTKVVYIYEVTAESGIEELKEYTIGQSNLNLIKSEIVKPDGSIVPAEVDYNDLVFTNLKVNDVIYLEYEFSENGFGRFYKDFSLSYSFNGVYPSQQTIFGIIHPAELTFNYELFNGDIPAKTKKLSNRNYTYWERKNIPAMPLYENYSLTYSDISNQIRVSSLKNWSDISNWYADLVSKNLKMDNIAVKTFNEIFPNGAANISQEDIAYKIYKYIAENITYSSVDFRQSGYVPQKPSKTITSKLGDCKDVSTLFVALAQHAGLKANLVLVLTNDNGINTLKLPTVNFNHCIVKVNLEGKDYFLEMTNSYLPFKALPMSLYKAKALVISFDKSENQKSGIINIPFDNVLSNSLVTATVIDITDNAKKFTTSHLVKGAVKPYYSELFSDKTTDDYRRQEMEKDMNSKLNKSVNFESAKLISNDRFTDSMKYETKFSISEKLQSVGSLKILEVPFLDKIYTRDIINSEKRNYDIDYASYEPVKEYLTDVTVNIPVDKKFVEIPEGKEVMYKGHQYKLKYELLSPTSLKITRQVNLSWENIKSTEYADFKKFVEDILAVEEQVIGFK